MSSGIEIVADVSKQPVVNDGATLKLRLNYWRLDSEAGAGNLGDRYVHGRGHPQHSVDA